MAERYRLLTAYKEEIVPALMKECGFKLRGIIPADIAQYYGYMLRDRSGYAQAYEKGA